jgi:hypothetical protein
MVVGFALSVRFYRVQQTTPLMWLSAAAAGAAVMAAIETGIRARYMWANHTEAAAEAKRRRQSEAQRKMLER